MSAKVSFEPPTPEGQRFSRTLPPTFLFLQSSIVKEQTPQTQCRPQTAFAFGAPSVAYAALLISSNSANKEANLFAASSVAAVVGEAYIGPTPQTCQHSNPSFLKFLRHSTEHTGKPCGRQSEMTTKPDRLNGGDHIRAALPVQFRHPPDGFPRVYARVPDPETAIARPFVDFIRHGRQLSDPRATRLVTISG